jgi:subtilisin family serine protease
LALILINEPLFTQAPPTAQAAPAVPRVPSELRDRAGLEGRIRVIVELNIAGGHLPEGLLANAANRAAQRQRLREQQTRVLSRLSPAAHRVVRRFQTVPYIALVVDSSALAALESQPDVLRVMEDSIIRPLLAESAPIVQSDQAWDAGYDGTGTTVAILDTGVEATHPFFGGRVVSEACYSGDDPAISSSFCPNGSTEQIGPGAAAPCWMEGCYHGTHVAGIAAGNGDLAGVPFSGVAKGAGIMAVQVFSQINDPWSCGGFAPCLGGFSSDIIAGMERVYAVAPALHVASVNLSLGEGRFTAFCDTQPYKPAIDNLRSIGVATVVASGNSGDASAMMAPACISSAVSVGATDKADSVAWFSNVAPFLSLFAPGDSITSSLTGATYGVVSGTSMATPHVAGAWALVKQAATDMNVAAVLASLRQTGKPIIDIRSGSPITVPRARVFQALATVASIPNPSPVVTALTPPSGRGGPLSLTIIGSGFNAFSVVRWNGHDRPTTVINTKKIQAVISSADLAAAGTADVTVFNPTPAGGTSVAMLFTIEPPPRLTISAPSVTTGGSETVTLEGGFGGNYDWLGLAAKGTSATSYIDYVYVGPGVTTRSWTMNMPTTAGTYEFRYFPNNSYTIAATSPSITVEPSPGPTLTVSTQNAAGGSPVTVTVTNGPGGSQDWLALAATSAGDTTYLDWTYVGAGATTRTWTVNMPAAAGTYEFRFFVNGGYTRRATSPSVIVTAPVPSPASLAVSTSNTTGGSSVTVTLTGGAGGTYDWLGLAATGASDTSVIQWIYVGAGVTTRTWTVPMPGTGGTYEFRYFPNGGYTRAATSPPITVAASAPPSLAVSAQSVNGGAAVTVTLTNGFGGTFDWLALASAGESNYSYIQWTYVTAGATTSAWTVTMPATAGTYEFRYFRDGGYTRNATSAAVTVK